MRDKQVSSMGKKEKREIKFRAWDEVNNIMHNNVANFYREGIGVSMDMTTGKEDWSLIYMQYTGLKDKNGKEIYEGDYLIDNEGFYYEVVFGRLPLNKAGDCVCTYQSFYAKGMGKWGFAPYYEAQEIEDWMSIVGNIYEKPELLNLTN